MPTITSRADIMTTKYGEACNQTRAAKILGCAARTIFDMLADGRLRRACDGKKVDVRSIAEYIEAPQLANRIARFQKKRGGNRAACRFIV